MSCYNLQGCNRRVTLGDEKAEIKLLFSIFLLNVLLKIIKSGTQISLEAENYIPEPLYLECEVL